VDVIARVDRVMSIVENALRVHADHRILLMEQASFAYQMAAYYNRASREVRVARD